MNENNVDGMVVMNDELIRYSRPREEMKNDKEGQELDFKTIMKLIFSYKQLYKIQSLRGLDNLRELKLDNNKITKIEGLETLYNLEKLDLSFNLITKIENLDKLENLRDLSLFNNQIERVEFSNFSKLKKITLISLANNKLKDLMQTLKALKPLKTLQVLTISNNPLTNDNEFKNYFYANLPDLKYLDYLYIDDTIKLLANDQKYVSDFKNYFYAQENHETEEIESNQNDEIMVKLNQYHLINYDKYLFAGNKDMEVFLGIKTAFEESTLKLSENLKTLVDDIKEKLKIPFQDKNEAISKFESAFYKMIEENEKSSLQLIAKYEHEKKKLERLIYETKVDNKLEEIEFILDSLKELDELLVGKETNLTNKLQKAYTKLKDKLGILYDNIERILLNNDGIKQVEEFISQFITKFTDEALIEAERYEKYAITEDSQNSINDERPADDDNIEDDFSPWTDDQQQFLENKDDIKNIISTIKESVDNKHKSVDSQIRTDIISEKNAYLTKTRKLIKKFNRENIFNIIELINKESNHWIRIKEELN